MREAVSITTALCLAGPVWVQASASMRAEIQAVRTQIEACWLVCGDLPELTLGFSLRVTTHGCATKQAVAGPFAAAKRAVLRCGRDGYSLPVEKYDQWRDIELRFDPERTNSK